MPTVVPSFLLKKLYVKGSFKTTSNGFELALRNALAPGTLTGFGTVKIDDHEIPLENLWIAVGDAAAVRASDITLASPRLFPMNSLVHFRVVDYALAPGRHRLSVSVNTKEVGELKIDAEDTIQ